MLQHFVVIAVGVLQCVGKNGQAVESLIAVDSAGERDHRRCSPLWPRRIGLEAVSGDLAEEAMLNPRFFAFDFVSAFWFRTPHNDLTGAKRCLNYNPGGIFDRPLYPTQYIPVFRCAAFVLGSAGVADRAAETPHSDQLLVVSTVVRVEPEGFTRIEKIGRTEASQLFSRDAAVGEFFRRFNGNARVV